MHTHKKYIRAHKHKHAHAQIHTQTHTRAHNNIALGHLLSFLFRYQFAYRFPDLLTSVISMDIGMSRQSPVIPTLKQLLPYQQTNIRAFRTHNQTLGERGVVKGVRARARVCGVCGAM